MPTRRGVCGDPALLRKLGGYCEDMTSIENADSAADKPATGFPEPPGRDPGDISQDESPHHTLNTPVAEPDPAAEPEPDQVAED
jgi:hypothetical protein